METVSYRIDGDGRFFKEYLSSQEIDVTDAVAKAFQQGQLISLPNVGTITTSDGVSYTPHLKYDTASSTAYWTIPLVGLPMNCAFRTIGADKDAYISPQFVYGPKDPVMSVVWHPGAGDSKGVIPQLRLVVAVSAVNLSGGKQYLFAFDAKGNAYKMPMANLYDTCELCCGGFDNYGGSHFVVLTRAMEQFRKGAWNADLYSSDREKSTMSFFRLKPEKEGFTTLPILDTWTKWCYKVSTATVKYAYV